MSDKARKQTTSAETVQDMVLLRLERDDFLEVRVVLSYWRGKPKIHVRQWLRDENDLSLWHPTRKGICLRAHEVDQIVDALQRASTLLQEAEEQAA